jgi:hydrogenase nickel incorporation protein HypA/HybF
MHEFSVSENIVDACLEHAQGRRIERLELTLGLFSGVVGDSLRFYIELMFEDRSLAKPEIILHTPPAQCLCVCGSQYAIQKHMQGCPQCGGFQRRVIEGRDCVIERLELADV